jgi:hypothetical protein
MGQAVELVAGRAGPALVFGKAHRQIARRDPGGGTAGIAQRPDQSARQRTGQDQRDEQGHRRGQQQPRDDSLDRVGGPGDQDHRQVGRGGIDGGGGVGAAADPAADGLAGAQAFGVQRVGVEAGRQVALHDAALRIEGQQLDGLILRQGAPQGLGPFVRAGDDAAQVLAELLGPPHEGAAAGRVGLAGGAVRGAHRFQRLGIGALAEGVASGAHLPAGDHVEARGRRAEQRTGLVEHGNGRRRTDGNPQSLADRCRRSRCRRGWSLGRAHQVAQRVQLGPAQGARAQLGEGDQIGGGLGLTAHILLGRPGRARARQDHRADARDEQGDGHSQEDGHGEPAFHRLVSADQCDRNV